VDDGPFSILGVEPPAPTTYARRRAGPPVTPPPGSVDILDFVTQRAVQTYMFYRRSFRDSVTADWLQAATGLGSLSDVHDFVFAGTAAYLDAIGGLPQRTVHVQTRVGCQGGSRDNPYLPVKYFGYDVTVSPPAVVAALCGVREGVATEVAADLGRVGAENERLWGAYLVGVVRPQDVEGGGSVTPSSSSGGRGDGGDGGTASTSPSSAGSGGAKKKSDDVEGGLVERNTLPVNEHDPSHSGRSALCGGTADLVSKYVTVAAVWRVVGALEARGGGGVAVDLPDDGGEAAAPERAADAATTSATPAAAVGGAAPPAADGAAAAAPPPTADAASDAADAAATDAAAASSPPKDRDLGGGGTVWGVGLDWEGARLDAAWLRAFIDTRGGGFEADAGYHVSRTFLKALLATPPVIVSQPAARPAGAADGAADPPPAAGGDGDGDGDGGGGDDVDGDGDGPPRASSAIHMVDTRRLAQAVLTERLAVAAEWKAALSGVPETHARLRRERLQKSLDASK